ncbi:tyrosinase family oxidase copper chaperone [Streptomyces sp. NPDC057137]|uniref:tyrosinase family oxidase copper chaperone n=1 Tax=Streptomyces sp. NPDC057137 TaxID=3346030 RepID=UPI00362D745B
MAGGTKLEPGPVGARPAESLALVPPQSHQPHEPPASPMPQPSPPPPPSRTRRLFLRAAFALGAIGGTAAALTPIFRADPRRTAAPAAPATDGAAADGPPPGERFDEMYGGRHIQGTEADVRIDGRPLHLMRRADSSYVSVVNHFESFPTALATARAAVDDLGGAQLSLAGPALH